MGIHLPHSPVALRENLLLEVLIAVTLPLGNLSVIYFWGDFLAAGLPERLQFVEMSFYHR